MWKIPQTIFITYHHFPVGSPPLSLRRRLRTTPSPWCSATTAPLGLDRLRLGLQVLLVLRVLHCASLTSEPNESWFTYSLVRTFGSLWLTISIYQLWFLVNISVVSFINQQTQNPAGHRVGPGCFCPFGEGNYHRQVWIPSFTHLQMYQMLASAKIWFRLMGHRITCSVLPRPLAAETGTFDQQVHPKVSQDRYSHLIGPQNWLCWWLWLSICV